MIANSATGWGYLTGSITAMNPVTGEKVAQHLFDYPAYTGAMTTAGGLVFTAISDELHNHYLLAYTPKRPPDGTWREITVRLLDRKDLEVRVRKGYFAVKRRRPPASTTSDH